uniref:WAT1-related protein n=1 Tax=Kalanchoe fedtschenkoi TaxID=63787 RepID=A0A7N1A7C6_KALFE
MDAWRKLGQLLDMSKAYIFLVLYELSLAIFMVLVESIITDGVNALVIVVYEHVISTIILFLLAFFLERNNRPPLSFKIICYAFLLGLLQVALCQTLLTKSLDYVSSTYQSVALNLVPSIVFLLALIFQQEKLKCWSIIGQAKIWGLILSAGGALALVLWKGPALLRCTPYVHTFQLEAISDVIGCTMIVVAILATSLWYVFLRHVIRLYPAEISLTAFMNLFGSIQTAVVAAFVCSKSAWELKWLHGLTLIVLLLGGFFVTGLAYYLMTWSVKLKGPVFTAAFNPLLILFSIILQTMLGSATHLGSVIGAVLVMIGLYLLLWAKANDMDEVNDTDDTLDSLSAPLVLP